MTVSTFHKDRPLIAEKEYWKRQGQEIAILKKEFSDFVVEEQRYLLGQLGLTTDTYKNSIIEEIRILKEKWDKEIDNEKRSSELKILLYAVRADFYRFTSSKACMPDDPGGHYISQIRLPDEL